MSLSTRIEEDLVNALKSKDELNLSVLRMVKSAIKNTAIAKGKDLEDSDVIAVIQKEIKQRRDSAEQFRATRPELAEKEEQEITVLEKYMPAQISDEELSTIVKNAITKTNAQTPKDMGKVMGIVMPQVQGRADGTRISSLVQELLKNG